MKRELLLSFATFLIAILSGCSTTTGLAPKVGHSGFDNARTVSIRPHGNAIKGMIGTGLGAQWNEAHKNKVIIIVAVFNEYTGITGAELNIDGNKYTLRETQTVTNLDAGGDIMKISTQGFIADLEIVKRIIESKRTWLRVHTPTGVMEDAVIDGTQDSKAYHALKRFIDEVEGKKS